MNRKKYSIADILRLAIVVAVLLISLFPIYWMLTTSVKPTNVILISPPVFFFQPTLEHYAYAFQQANFAHYIANTLIVA